MAKNRLYRALSRIVDIRPGEEIIVFLLFLYFFLIMAPFYVIKPVRNAEYLEDVGSLGLPIAYLLTAVIMGFFIHFYSKLQVRVHRRILIISSLTFFIVTCLLSREFFIKEYAWMPYAFWVWANIYVVVVVTQFWLLVNDFFNPREAKRLIGFFGSGGLLGGVLGGLLTGLLARAIPDHLLLIPAGILILSGFVVNYIFIWQRKTSLPPDKADIKEKEKERKPAKVGFLDSFNTVRKDRFLIQLSAVVILTFMVATFVDYQSNTVVKSVLERKSDMAEFFGYFNAGLLVLPFFLQLLMTSNLIKRYGIRITLLLFPFILFLCTLGIAIWPGLLFAVVIKGSDKSLSFSLNQSVRELLYIPISPELKTKAKLFIDMFLNRFAKGIGALILLIFFFYPPPEFWIRRVQIVSIISFVFIVAWIFFNLKVSKEYTDTIKQKLEMKWDRADRLVADQVDVDYTKLVFDTIESRNRSSVLYAMHLFDLIKQDKLTPEVQKLISYKSDEVMVSSLGGLFESGEALLSPEIEESIGEETLEKDIKEIMSLDVYQEVMKGYVEKVLVDKSREGETAKMELAKAMGLMEVQSPLVQKLDELLLDESPEVSRYAMESAARMKKREYVPLLVKKLSSPVTREDASIALEKFGSRVTGTLADYLGDPEEELELRKEVASILARISTQEAADFLSWEMEEAGGEMDDELIDAMDRIRSENSDVQFSEDVMNKKIAEEVKKYYQILVDFCDLKPEAKEEQMKKGLPKDLSVVLMNVFKLLGLIYPREDIARAFQNIRTGTKDSVAYAVELLDNTLQKELKDILFPIIEDLSLEERMKRCRNLLRNFPNL
ncbi:MAG: MFS transporter [Candidatus Aminicenantes bacterium]|nr:MFS transporter [Candidatus Aminicenantes bacterium]